ncbi:type II toxin-antitoxin system VapC family toxin [Akkermansiaceae bacterium]|nr:type II toxin-antitoxin system VapC family toxin [Akkermansiaceae bacterium]
MRGSLVALDTNVVVSHFRDPEAYSNAMLAHELYLPVTVIAELRGGAKRSRRPEYQDSLIDQFLDSVDVLYTDLETAKVYGDLWGELAAKGKMIPTNDIWIAASAIQHGLKLITNDAHFGYVAGLEHESW